MARTFFWGVSVGWTGYEVYAWLAIEGGVFRAVTADGRRGVFRCFDVVVRTGFCPYDGCRRGKRIKRVRKSLICLQ